MMFSRIAQLRTMHTNSHPVDILRQMAAATAACDDELASLHAQVAELFRFRNIYLDGDIKVAAHSMLFAAVGEGHLYTQLDFDNLLAAAKAEFEVLDNAATDLAVRFPAIFSPSSDHTQLLWKLYIDHTNKEQDND